VPGGVQRPSTPISTDSAAHSVKKGRRREGEERKNEGAAKRDWTTRLWTRPEGKKQRGEKKNNSFVSIAAKERLDRNYTM